MRQLAADGATGLQTSPSQSGPSPQVHAGGKPDAPGREGARTDWLPATMVSLMDVQRFRQIFCGDDVADETVGADAQAVQCLTRLPRHEAPTVSSVDEKVQHVRHCMEQASRQDTAPAHAMSDGMNPLGIEAVAAVVRKVYLGAYEKGERFVRIAFEERQLPATEMSVFEDAGCVNVAFVTRDAAVHRRLVAGAQPLAARVAQVLPADVRLSVAPGGGHTFQAVEVRADAPLQKPDGTDGTDGTAR